VYFQRTGLIKCVRKCFPDDVVAAVHIRIYNQSFCGLKQSSFNVPTQVTRMFLDWLEVKEATFGCIAFFLKVNSQTKQLRALTWFKPT
jgi:hypothetical protein